MEFTSRQDESEYGINIQYLPILVLYIIFENLDLRSLLVLSSVSKKFHIVIDDYLNLRSSSLLVTNQSSVKVQEKSLQFLSGYGKHKLNFYWRKKFYCESIYLESKEKFCPWLRVDGSNLYISQGPDILLFERTDSGIQNNPSAILKGHSQDVTRFAVQNGILISGGNDGKICYWKGRKPLFSAKNRIRWNENLYVDFCGKTLVSGFSVQGTVKCWSVKERKFQLEEEFRLNAKLRTIALSEDGSFCAIGTSGYNSSPLKLLDINEGFIIDLGQRFKSGCGIFGIIWEDPNIFLTCGYDHYVRMWDLRLGTYVNYWTDPFNDAISSIATDYNWTIMSGSGIQTRVVLWDKRRTSHVLIYHILKHGPVYSFDFDPKFLFAALESSLHVLDFSIKPAVPHIL